MSFHVAQYKECLQRFLSPKHGNFRGGYHVHEVDVTNSANFNAGTGADVAGVVCDTFALIQDYPDATTGLNEWLVAVILIKSLSD